MAEEMPQRKFIWFAVLMVLLGAAYCFVDSIVQTNPFTIFLFGGFLLCVFIAFISFFIIYYRRNRNLSQNQKKSETAMALVRSVDKAGTFGSLHIPLFEVVAEITKANGNSYLVIIKVRGSEVERYGIKAGSRIVVSINSLNGDEVEIDFNKSASESADK